MSAPTFAEICRALPAMRLSLLREQGFDPAHMGFNDNYYRMLEEDHTRMDAFREAFAWHDLRGKVVCEVGVGRLALTRMFLAEVRHAYLIESNPELFDYIRDELARSGFSHKVTLIFQNAYEVSLPEPVDCLIGELMSIFCANEHQVPIMRHLRRFLKPGGAMIPFEIRDLAQLAQARFEDGQAHYPIAFTRFLPTLLSNLVELRRMDLRHWDPPTDSLSGPGAETPWGQMPACPMLHAQCPAVPMLSGRANALLLHSWVSLAPGVHFTGTDSLMPPTVIRLAREVSLVEGQEVLLAASYRHADSLDQARFWVEERRDSAV